MDAIATRLQEYLSVKKLTAKDFERITGLGNGTCAKISTTTRQTTFNRISNSPIDLNIDWLLTGEGEMLKSEKISEKNNMENIEDELPQSDDAFSDMDNVNILVSQHPDSPRMIPFYDADTTEFFAVIERKDKQIEEKDRQINRLLTIIEKMQGS